MVAFVAYAVFSQDAAPPPAFEVASVRPSAGAGGQAADERARGWGDVTGRVALMQIPLMAVLLRAFGLQPYQLSGPAWLNADPFDIFANVPAGAPKEQIPLMFQALLAERFKLRFHRETQVAPVYALVVAAGGPKMKEPLPDDPNATEGFKVTGSGEKRVISGAITGGPFGRSTLSVANGTLHTEFASMTMESLAEYLSQGQVDLPVVDMTELKGSYRVPLDFSMSDMPGVRARLQADQGNASQAVPTASDPSGPSLRESIEKLGLKLERRRLPVEKLVIDHIERAPTGN